MIKKIAILFIVSLATIYLLPSKVVSVKYVCSNIHLKISTTHIALTHYFTEKKYKTIAFFSKKALEDNGTVKNNFIHFVVKTNLFLTQQKNVTSPNHLATLIYSAKNLRGPPCI